MKGLKKALVVMLTLAMTFSSFTMLNNVNVYAEETAKNYTIYPTPHDVNYSGGEFSISDGVNVVFGDSIDKFTREHLNNVLSILNKKATVTNAVANGKTNVIVGVYGSNDYADKYFSDNNLISDKGLFDKYDSYILSIKDGVIGVLGKDTDAAFYGITSLKYIFNQSKGSKILNLTINDYAEIQARGFIEGYYGNPWSNEDRADLMSFAVDYKLNQYIYAPKDDPKHNSEWKTMYTDEELAEIEKLANAGNKSKCYYVYALHPFMKNPLRFDENYNVDLNIIKTKFEQLMSVGVKQFSILADDAGEPAGGGASYIRLMSDLTDWLIEKQASVEGLKVNMTFCPANYHGDGLGVTSLKGMPDTVSIIQTGGQVWGSTNATFLNNFNNSMGTAPFMWINWPCSDNTKDGLIMGGATRFLIPGADPTKMQGIVLNPMQQSEPSKHGIIANADYAWNIWESESDYEKVWYDGFNLMDHGTIEDTESSIALRELSKHMMYSNTGIPESKELGPKLTKFMSDFNAGADIKAQAEELKSEFKKLQDAAAFYKANPSNERTRDQIIYWLDCWQDTTEAIISYLDTTVALQDEEENNVVWDLYATGQSAFEKSKTHALWYIDHWQYAKIGRQYITPFMTQLDAALSSRMESIINPDKQIIKYITNRTDKPTGSTDNIFDNKANTEIVYMTPNAISEGTYVGISYNKAIDIDKVIFRLGANDNLRDTFLKAKVQYTNDGKEWKDLNETIYDLPNEVVLEDLGLKAVKGIRMIATVAKTNTWLGVRDIAVNPVDEPVVEEDNGTLSIDKVSVQGGDIKNVTDGKTSTFTHFAEAPYKGGEITDYIPVDATITLTYENAKKLGTINFVQDSGTDKLKKYVIEYSEDGKTWKSLEEYAGNATVSLDVSDQNIMAKAIRVRNLELNLKSEKVGYWWKVFDFSMTDTKAAPYTLEYTSRWSTYQSTVDKLNDGDDSTYVHFDSGPADDTLIGDYIGWDLGNVTKIGKIHAVVGNDKVPNDKWTKYKLEYSSDNENWTTFKTFDGAGSGKDIIDVNFYGIEARYVRLTNLAKKHAWVIFSEFTVKEYDPNTDFDDANVYSNTNFRLLSEYSEDATKLSCNTDITLSKDQFIGVDLSRIKDIKEINIDTTNGEKLTLQVSKNKLEWENVNLNTRVELPDARYVRLINLTNAEVTFTLNNFIVTSNEVFTPRLYDTTFGIEPSWGVTEDSRNNGAAFDGNVDTTTEFGTLPQKGEYAIYDLGQVRLISKLEMFCQDTAKNYLRDAEILISNDLENWTKVITIGDGIENKNDANVTCLNSDAGYKASSTYPNKVSVVGEINPESARYLKIIATASNNNRAVVFNEIVINDGEYAPVSNDPTFEASVVEVKGFVPQNMFDGDLTTSYKPNTTEAGFIKYTLSDNLDVKKMNIIQKGTLSNAKVMALVMIDGQKEWIQVGTLDKSLNEIYLPFENTFELKIEWNANEVPTISEIVTLNDNIYLPELDALTKYVNSLNVDENLYTSSSYANYLAKLQQAKNIIDTASGDKEKVITAYRELQVAYSQLVTRGDTQLIRDEMAKIEALVADDYTEATWSSLQKVVSDVKVQLEKDANDISVQEVAEMLEALQVAKSNLVTKVSVSKEVLQNYIDTNELDTLDTSKYLTSTAKPFIDALKAAHDLISDDKATLKQLEDALTALQETRSALVLKATDDEVNALKGLIDSYVETDYTASSWKDFAKVLADVNEALKGETSSEDIAKLTEDLEAAAKELVKRGDLTDINILLETAKALDENKFTADSYKKLSDVITKIEKALKDTSEMLQDEVDALQKELQDAIDALVVKPEVTPVPGGDGTITPDKSDANTPDKSTGAKTGDTAMIGTFVALGMLSVAGLWLYRKKDNC